MTLDRVRHTGKPPNMCDLALPPSLFSHLSPPLCRCFSSSSADISSAQCIPAPLATPIPVSDEPATPCTDLSESPSSQALPPMPYSVPVSEHMEECSSVIKDELDSLLDCMPKKVSEASEGETNKIIIFPL